MFAFTGRKRRKLNAPLVAPRFELEDQGVEEQVDAPPAWHLQPNVEDAAVLEQNTQAASWEDETPPPPPSPDSEGGERVSVRLKARRYENSVSYFLRTLQPA